MGIKSGFKRTPKLKIESVSDNLKDRQKYHIPLDFHAILELAMGLYCFFCVYISFVVDKPFIIGFMVVYGFGFLFVAINTVRESTWNLSGKLGTGNETVSEIA